MKNLTLGWKKFKIFPTFFEKNYKIFWRKKNTRRDGSWDAICFLDEDLEYNTMELLGSWVSEIISHFVYHPSFQFHG
jgi:hypothetical protein